MITAVHDAMQRQQYFRAAQGWDFFRATLGMRLALYGEQPAAGWSFYTGARGVCAALAVRGETAFACGAWAAEELGAFLCFLGVQTVVTPGAERSLEYRPVSVQKCPAAGVPPMQQTTVQGRPKDKTGALAMQVPDFPAALRGYQPTQALHLYTLPAGGRLLVPLAQAVYHSESQPPMRTVTKLLWENGPEADAFYAEACAARNRGWAEYRLAAIDGEAISTVGACAIYGGEAYMAAGQTAQAWRGKGIAGQMIVRLANELAARGLCVSLLCEPALCGFYERLGFAAGGCYTKWNAAPQKAAQRKIENGCAADARTT